MTAVLVCYLDDSGKDPQSHITTVAGYIARADAWEIFETEIEPFFAEAGVHVLHAKQLHDTDGDFKGWTVLRKQAFVARICQAMSRHVALGLSMSAVNGTYAARAAESDRKRTVTPYTFCFSVIIDWILRDIRIGRAAHTEGVALILECGHQNNAEAEEYFHSVRQLHNIEDALRSISFVPKDQCRAIQIADLLAFYSRRDSAAYEKAASKGLDGYQTDTMIKLITGSLPHRGFVATDFVQREPS